MKSNRKRIGTIVSAGILCIGLTLAAAGCSGMKINTGEIRAEGETTIIETPTKSVRDYSAAENAYIVAGRLKNLPSYRSEIVGETVSAMPKYTQKIEDIHIKNGKESYAQATSTSLFVNVGKQAFFKGNKVVMRDAANVSKDEWKDSFSVTTLEEYRSKIGGEPTALSNYILNDETIKSAERIPSTAENEYTFRYEIDPVFGTSRYAVKMMNYAALKSLPEFESCTLELTFDKDWNPVSLTAKDKYKIAYGVMNLSCTSTLTETFYDIGKDLEIPGADLFRARLGDDATDIDPDDGEKDDLSVLADAVLHMDLAGGLKINGALDAATASGTISLPVDAWLSFDLEKFASGGLSEAFRGRVNTNLFGVPVKILYPGDGWLYTDVGGAKYKYALAPSEEGAELEEVLSYFHVEKVGENGNTYVYQVRLNDDKAALVNTMLDALASLLPDAAGALKDFSLKEAGAMISIYKKGNEAGRITAAAVFADFGAAKLNADVTISETAEKLPSAEELASYAEGGLEKLLSQFVAFIQAAGMDFKGGVKIRGDLSVAASGGEPLSLPVDAWLSFDLDKLLSEGAASAFRARASTKMLGVGVEFLYAGDGWLYVSVGSTKYKYELPASEGSADVSGLLEFFTFAKESGSGNTGVYRLSLSEKLLGTINAALGEFTSTLPEAAGALKDLSAREISALITVRRGANELGRITGAELVADFGAAELTADLTIAEGGETLPSAEELAAYTEGDAAKLAANFGAVLKIAGGFAGLDWTTGIKTEINVGVDSLMVVPLPAEIQIVPEALLTGNVFGAIRVRVKFELGLMFGQPGIEIYYENGMLYVFNTAQAGNTVYATSVSTVDVKAALGGLVMDNVGALIGSDFDFVGFLAEAAMNSATEISSPAEGVTRVELHLSEGITALLGAGYSSIIKTVLEMDFSAMGTMGAFVQAILQGFDFPIERTSVRADFKDDKLSAISLRLTNDSEATDDEGKSFLAELDINETLAAGEAEEIFAGLQNYLAAIEEGAEVQALLAKLKADGVEWLGDSYGAKLDEAEAAYNALSPAAQKTVTDYAALAELRKEWTKLRASVNQFVTYLDELKTYDFAAEADKIGGCLEKMNPLFDAFDQRQAEYLGGYAKAEYLKIREAYERDVSVAALIADIDKLTREEYPTSAKLSAAIAAAEARYEALYETSKPLVTNFAKIEEARAVCGTLVLEELNASMAKTLADLDAVSASTTYDSAKTLKAEADGLAAQYEKLSGAEQALVTNYAAFAAAREKFTARLGDNFKTAVDALGGVEGIGAGDAAFAALTAAKNWKSLLTAAQLTALKTEADTLDACAQRHRSLETGSVERLIADIGAVEFTDECRAKILAARAAYENLRGEYLTWCANRTDLSAAEAEYVKLSVAGLDAAKVTESDRAQIELARSLYNEATSAYANNFSFKYSIKSLLRTFNTELQRLEAALAALA